MPCHGGSSLGDDVYADDPTVRLFEERAAALLGKEDVCIWAMAVISQRAGPCQPPVGRNPAMAPAKRARMYTSRNLFLAHSAKKRRSSHALCGHEWTYGNRTATRVEGAVFS